MIGDIVNYIVKEWRVIRQAPVTFIGAGLVMLGLIWGAMQWRYVGIIENKGSAILSLRDENGRLRVALGLTPAQSALISLSNAELKAKAATVVSKLNEIAREDRNESESIKRLPNLTDVQRQARQEEMEKELDQDFIRDVRSEAFNVDTELRRRLGPKGTAAIVGIGPTVTARDGTQVSILQLAMTGSAGALPAFDLGYIPTLSLGIDQMAKMLPDKG
jgi:hypothetical protein